MTMFKKALKKKLVNLNDQAVELNKRNILSLASTAGPAKRMLDLGCDDGTFTLQLAEAVNATDVIGIEIVPERAEIAARRSIDIKVCDLANKFPLSDSSIDFIHSNQVIEHVPDVDHFASEIYRVLKPGGSAVISTENAASWHNIFSLLFGWQMFSSTNISSMNTGIGNPIALHRGLIPTYKSWSHKTIFSWLGLKEFMEAHGFQVIASAGAGYHPLPADIGRWDERHSHYISVHVEKPVHQ